MVLPPSNPKASSYEPWMKGATRWASTIFVNGDDIITIITHSIHVWYLYLHEWLIFMVHVGKYVNNILYMDPMGYK